MVLLVVMEGAFLPGTQSGNDIYDRTQSIGIRQHACPRHQLAIARVVGGHRRHQPTPDEMGEG